jgi:hypothetical protein
VKLPDWIDMGMKLKSVAVPSRCCNASKIISAGLHGYHLRGYSWQHVSKLSQWAGKSHAQWAFYQLTGGFRKFHGATLKC